MDHTSILTRAIAIIEERGWVQGHYSIPHKKDPKQPGPVCASRAINDASSELGATDVERWDARYAVIEIIGRDAIATWNDNGKTTKQTIVETFKKAATLERTWVNHLK